MILIFYFVWFFCFWLTWKNILLYVLLAAFGCIINFLIDLWLWDLFYSGGCVFDLSVETNPADVFGRRLYWKILKPCGHNIDFFYLVIGCGIRNLSQMCWCNWHSWWIVPSRDRLGPKQWNLAEIQQRNRCNFAVSLCFSHHEFSKLTYYMQLI